MNLHAVALGALAACALAALAGPPPAAVRPVRAGPRPRGNDGRRMPIPRLSAGDVAAAGLLALALGVLAAPLALAGAAAPLLRRQHQARRVRRARARAIAAGLPDAVDLLLLCAGAGFSLPLAHAVVAARVPAPVGDALVAAADSAERGVVRADALLGALVPLGDRAAALGHVLVDHLRYGVPLVPGLERLGLELRLDRRRRAEEEARRVPLRLLAPLLCCVLPAFGLLTVVPLLVATLQSLPR